MTNRLKIKAPGIEDDKRWVSVEAGMDDTEILDAILNRLDMGPEVEWEIVDDHGFASKDVWCMTLQEIADALNDEERLTEEYDREVVEAAVAVFESYWVEKLESGAYMGCERSKELWAEQYLDDCGMLSEVPEPLCRYIDFESYARDCEISGDVSFHNAYGWVYVFNNH